MKQLISLFLLSSFLLGLTAATTKSSQLVGKWRGEDGGEVGFITFNQKGYVTFSIRDQEIGGKEYLSDGVVYDMKYETDETREPYTIDFVIMTHEDRIEIARMPGIFKLVDKETLVINMKFDGTERPEFFDETSDDQITLRKTK
jgi:hypothetical protein